jgi:tubulin polyglutamylase TTLL6/13
MMTIARKALLGRLMEKMNQLHPQEYDFTPKQWVLPEEQHALWLAVRSRPTDTFILKPNAGCQGRGILLVQGGEGEWPIPPEQAFDLWIAQEYIEVPFF